LFSSPKKRKRSDAGLPDGVFSNQNSRFGQILEGLPMEGAGIIYGHLVYFTATLYILWPFGLLCSYLVYFYRFGMLYQQKSGNPVPTFGVLDFCFKVALSASAALLKNRLITA
jgi:hypothetical protein